VSKYFIAKPGGSSHGPYSLEQILAGCANGKVSPSMMVCAEGSSEWMPVTSLPGVSFPAGAGRGAPMMAPAPMAPSMPAAQHAGMAAPMRGGMPLPTFAPFAAWSFVICCIGYVWGIVTWFKMCGAINALAQTDRCKGASILVPIWWIINMGEVVETMNHVIATRGLQVPPLKNSIAMNILLSPVPFMNMISTWNAIAAAENARR
jgi:hypothetical protein